VLNPSDAPLGRHLVIADDGAIRGLTTQGRELIHVCQLDRRNLTEFRRGVLEVLQTVRRLSEKTRREILRHYFGFPSNLPRLPALRPPGGNSRPDGILNCHYEQRKTNKLPEFY
jgi:hypothetical protein